MYIHACIYIHNIFTHTHTQYIYIYRHTQTYTRAWNTNAILYMHTDLHNTHRTSVWMPSHMHMCVCIYEYICAHTHTHYMHTHIRIPVGLRMLLRWLEGFQAACPKYVYVHMLHICIHACIQAHVVSLAQSWSICRTRNAYVSISSVYLYMHVRVCNRMSLRLREVFD